MTELNQKLTKSLPRRCLIWGWGGVKILTKELGVREKGVYSKGVFFQETVYGN